MNMPAPFTVVLRNPDEGAVVAAATGAVVDVSLDRYPRWGCKVDLVPDPAVSGVPLWQTPYGTRIEVITSDGALLFTGPVTEAEISQPSGLWRLTAADDTYAYRKWVYPLSTPQRIAEGSGTVTLPQLIANIAADAGIPPPPVTGTGGSIDLANYDAAGLDGWAIIDEQALAAGLEVTAVGDGSLTIGPAPAIGDPVGLISVGETGTITGYTVTMQRRFNRIVITNICKSEGQDDRYVDGVWSDTGPLTGYPAINVTTYVASVQRGADWWADPAGHQQEADDAAAAAAPRLRGDARQVSLTSAPDFTIRPGQTLDVGFRGGGRDRMLVVSVEWDMSGPMRIAARNPDPGDLDATTLLRRRHAEHT